MFSSAGRYGATDTAPRLGFGTQVNLDRRFHLSVGRALRTLVIGGLIAFVAVLADTRPAESAGAHMPPLRAIAPPAGFQGLCNRYTWVCAGASKSQRNLSEAEILSLARQVNRTVNRQVREISDQSQYRLIEVWALPTKRGGDCEDFALLKKLELLKRGVSPERLLIATALTAEGVAHAVLILRTSQGDLVLDNRTGAIKSWRDTGYSFLRMQNPKSKSRWQMVLAGGMF